MRKRIFPLHLACAAVLAVSSLSPMYAAASEPVEISEEGATAQEAAPEIEEEAVTEETEAAEETTEEPAEEITEEPAEEAGAQQEEAPVMDLGIPEDTQTQENETPTDAAGNEISQETAEAIDNADLGADQITDTAVQEQAAADAADAAETALQDPQEIADPAMDKSSIGAAFDDTFSFTKEDTTVYLLMAAAVKDAPSEEGNEIGSLDKYSRIRLTGSNELRFWEVEYQGDVAYIDSSLITRDYAEIEALMEDDERKAQTEADSKAEQEVQIAEETEETRGEWETALKESRRAALASQTRNPNWGGPVLSRSQGSVYGPSGKETYYNLNMSGCVSNMNRRGYYAEVWVRNDGCKMFGDYIMCAAHLGNHPYGSLVECSLGTCIVVDTGGFAAGNPDQLDIAVTW